MRHPRVEEPYDASEKFVPSPDFDTNQGTFRVSSDGSSTDYVGGAGITVLPPYGRIPEDLVTISVPIADRCTNIRAELIAAAQALEVCQQLRWDFPGSRLNCIATPSMSYTSFLTP